MKRLALLLAVGVVTLVSGCAVYVPGPGYHHYHDGYYRHY